MDVPNSRDHLRGNVVLYGEKVLRIETTLVGFGPYVRATGRVEQLDTHAHRIGRFTHTTFGNVVGAQLAPDLAYIHGAAFVLKSGVACQHAQIRESGETAENLLCDSVREKILLRIAAHVGERENRDDWAG